MLGISLIQLLWPLSHPHPCAPTHSVGGGEDGVVGPRGSVTLVIFW